MTFSLSAGRSAPPRPETPHAIAVWTTTRHHTITQSVTTATSHRQGLVTDDRPAGPGPPPEELEAARRPRRAEALLKTRVEARLGRVRAGRGRDGQARRHLC